MKRKAKGTRNERRGRDFLYEKGAILVIRSAGSLGKFDLLALFPKKLLAVQVVTNRRPSGEKLKAILHFPDLPYLEKAILHYQDRKRELEVRFLGKGQSLRKLFSKSTEPKRQKEINNGQHVSHEQPSPGP